MQDNIILEPRGLPSHAEDLASDKPKMLRQVFAGLQSKGEMRVGLSHHKVTRDGANVAVSAASPLCFVLDPPKDGCPLCDQRGCPVCQAVV